MSNGISFDTAKDANEYIEQKQTEGYEAYFIRKDNKYIAYVLGKVLDKHATLKHVNQGEMSRKDNPAEYDFDLNEIRYTDEVNTKGKTHEVGHLKLGHGDYNKYTNAKQIAKEEIDAQIFAYSKNDKSIDWKVAIPAIVAMKEEKGANAKNLVFMIKDLLKEKGIDLPHEAEEAWINYLEK
jgi:hypothetical protein